MKTKMLSLAAIGALMALGACSKCPDKAGTCSKDSDTDVVYTGVVPGADVYGVRYTLLLDYDDDEPGGDYELVQTYFNVDSVGIADVASFASKGDFTTGTRDGKQYIQLAGKGAEQTYFVVTGDDTIEMTGAELTSNQVPGMNYTLTKAK